MVAGPDASATEDGNFVTEHDDLDGQLLLRAT